MGEVYARSWLIIGASAGAVTRNRFASYAVQRGVGISITRAYVTARSAASKSGSFQTVISSEEPMLLVQVAFATSTVLPTAGSLPSAPTLRSSDQATS